MANLIHTSKVITDSLNKKPQKNKSQLFGTKIGSSEQYSPFLNGMVYIIRTLLGVSFFFTVKPLNLSAPQTTINLFFPEGLPQRDRDSGRLSAKKHSQGKFFSEELTQCTFRFLGSRNQETTGHIGNQPTSSCELMIQKPGRPLTTTLPYNPPVLSLIVISVPTEIVLDIFKSLNLPRQSSSSPKLSELFWDIDFLPTFSSSLQHLQQVNEKLKRHLLRIKVEELICYILDAKGYDFLNFLVSSAPGWQSRFLNVVQQYRLEKLTVLELASKANMSPSTFKREFKRQFHQAPANWFLKQRMANATLLMTERSKRPSDIYEEIGYNSLSTFIQAFKSFYGLTPKQYCNR